MAVNPGGPTINELHYDNAGADTGEFVEIIAPNGTSLAGYELVLYNGSNGLEYASYDMGTITGVDGGDGNDYYVVNHAGIQNGAPDGLALVGPGGVCEFLSYEGTFTAMDGPANGAMSTDIGVSETGSTPAGDSLGVDPATGNWVVFDNSNGNATPGAVNCFVKGTRILTSKGYRNIEDIKIGDLVKNEKGKGLPVKWVGIQTINLTGKELPVMIKKSSLDNNVPSHDIVLSPDHAILVEGRLINAGALVNGNTIINVKPGNVIQYYHIELDQHEIIFAENMPTESFLPHNVNRQQFDNSEEYLSLYNDESNRYCLPLDYPRIINQYKVPSSILKMINGSHKETA